ncbi:MAG: hypothetical protein HZB56_19235 [Deltaproteobacteria bacterium]|nr:hypothetical protein [Deltaproteobacteria bacterium]
MKYLVGSPQATDFLDQTHIPSGLNVMLGDPDNCDPMVAPEMRLAHIALRDGATKIAALVADPTRPTDVEKHVAARKVANAVIDRLEKTKKVILERADYVLDEATRQADLALGPKSDRGSLHSEIRQWLRETSRLPDGLEKIRSALEAGGDDLAAVLWHSPTFLTGLPPDLHETLRFEALQRAKPDTCAAFSSSVGLRRLADRYDGAIRRTTIYFYNPTVAEKAAKRVEV